MWFNNKNILLISPESWGKNHVSKHHYAITLALEGAKVYFLNPPSQQNFLKEKQNGLFICDYKPLFRGLGYLPAFISGWLIKKELDKLELTFNVRFDVIWNFDSSRFFELSQVKNKLKICHLVDMAENMHRSSLAKSADICFCTSDYLKQTLNAFNRKVFKIHHGYQQSKIKNQMLGSTTVQVGMVGNLSRPCIDWETILTIVAKNPTLDFNFVGNYHSSNLSNNTLNPLILEKLKCQPNVKMLGEMDSALIPQFLANTDILLCIYKMDTPEDFAQHSNLHKIMEYLGCGNVIISSWVDEYKNQTDLLEMRKVNKDLIPLFETVSKNLAAFNSPLMIEKRKIFSQENSYKKQLERISEQIKQHV
jgi:hypothetical protein